MNERQESIVFSFVQKWASCPSRIDEMFISLCEICNNILPETAAPSWDTAPEWANYLAQDGCGRWYWYETLPKVDEDSCEWHKEPLSEMYQATVSSWETTLQQRLEK
jgi:hypothetical protein